MDRAPWLSLVRDFKAQEARKPKPDEQRLKRYWALEIITESCNFSPEWVAKTLVKICETPDNTKPPNNP